MMKTLKFFPVWMFVLATFFLSCSKDEAPTIPYEPDLEERGANTQTSPVINVNNEVVGEATLIRQKNGITAHYESTDLIKDHAYTLWWVIWNKPENCNATPCEDPDFANPVEAEVMYATGKVAGGSGKEKFSAHLKVGNDSGSINDIFGLPPAGGLQDVETAEVHLVIRSHGPKIPGEVHNQIQTYGGGCQTELQPFTEIPDEVGECADIEYAVFLP